MRDLTPFEARTLELLFCEQEIILLKRRALICSELAVAGQEPKPRDQKARDSLDEQELILLRREEDILHAAKGLPRLHS